MPPPESTIATSRSLMDSSCSCRPGGDTPYRTRLSTVEEHEPRRGSLTVADELLEEEEQLWVDDADDHTGWFCVSTDPFPCPAAACTFVAVFMTAAHLVLVWEE